MINIESSEWIGRPAEEVFAFVSDVRNDPRWHTKFEPVTTLTVEPGGGGSRITRHLDMEPEGMFRIMAPFTGGMMRKRNAAVAATGNCPLRVCHARERALRGPPPQSDHVYTRADF